MNVFGRLFYASVLVLTTLGWQWALKTYDGLLGERNIISLAAAVVVGLLWIIGFKDKRRQSFWKLMMVVLTLTSIAMAVWFLSGVTLILGALVAMSLLSLGVLYDEGLADWWNRICDNRAARQERRAMRRAAHAEDDHLVESSMGNGFGGLSIG